MKFLILGGGTAGSVAAFEIRKQDKDAQITILEASDKVAHAQCSMPYLIEGYFEDCDELLVYDKKTFEDAGIKFVFNAPVKEIGKDYVKYGKDGEENFDKLIIATGVEPKIPPIKNLENYLTFKSLEDAKAVQESLNNEKKYSIIGAGLIGVELAYALRKKGKEVKIIEAQDEILSAVLSKNMARKIEKMLVGEGIEISKSTLVEDASELEGQVIVSSGVELGFDYSKFGLEVNHGIDRKSVV